MRARSSSRVTAGCEAGADTDDGAADDAAAAGVVVAPPVSSASPISGAVSSAERRLLLSAAGWPGMRHSLFGDSRTYDAIIPRGPGSPRVRRRSRGHVTA